MTHILIAASQARVRADLRQWLLASGHTAPVGEAPSPVELLERFAAEAWDLVIFDVAAPGQDGLSVLQVLRERWPHTRVFAISVEVDPDLVRHCLDLGVHGYLAQADLPGEFVRAISHVMAGERYVGRAVIEALAA